MKLGAVMIAKDEEALIGRCLTAARDAGVEVVTLVDMHARYGRDRFEVGP